MAGEITTPQEQKPELSKKGRTRRKLLEFIGKSAAGLTLSSLLGACGGGKEIPPRKATEAAPTATPTAEQRLVTDIESGIKRVVNVESGDNWLEVLKKFGINREIQKGTYRDYADTMNESLKSLNLFREYHNPDNGEDRLLDYTLGTALKDTENVLMPGERLTLYSKKALEEATQNQQAQEQP